MLRNGVNNQLMGWSCNKDLIEERLGTTTQQEEQEGDGRTVDRGERGRRTRRRDGKALYTKTEVRNQTMNHKITEAKQTSSYDVLSPDV